MTTTTVRVRGIYTTAITQYLRARDVAVVQPSDPIRERFDDEFDVAPANVTIETTRDRQGIGLSGDPSAVDEVGTLLEEVAIDAFRWDTPVSRGAVFDAEVLEASGGSGAVVDLGDGARGYLQYDDVDGYVDDGDRYRVQVRDPAPPWDDDRPLVRPGLEVRTGLLTLSRDRTGVSAAVDGDRGAELVGMTDLLPADVPDGWGLRWRRTASDADLEAMGAALERGVERVDALEDALSSAVSSGTDSRADSGEGDSSGGSSSTRSADDSVGSGPLAALRATAWLWFGRESRAALDEERRAVETTMPGHHRIKAADRAASAAVDFAEAVCNPWSTGDDDGSADPDDEFPFGAVTRQFGPTRGDRIALGHGKPDGRLITLGRGELTEWDPAGTVTLERTMRGGGTYDALGVAKETGDVAVTRLREGRWWYPTTYRDADGDSKGTYVNVCTPVELFPDCVRYVDLYVDVIRHADGTVAVVDEDELEEAVSDGLVSDDLASKARSVADAVERALSK